MADWSIGQRFRFTPESPPARVGGADGDPATTSEKRTESHEARHPPAVRPDDRRVLLWQHVRDPQHRQGRRDPRRDLQRLPPVLHGQAARAGHRGPGRQVPGQVRQGPAGQEEVATPTAPAPAKGVGRRSHVGTEHVGAENPGDVVSNERLAALLDEYADLEKQMSDPSIHADQTRVRRVGRRFAELAGGHKAHADLEEARADLAAARELAAEDPAFATEADQLAAELPALEARLAEMLAPRDPHDAKDVIVEIKAGEGGQESALFAGDLLRMYTRYAEKHGWTVEVIDAQESDLGGVKDVSVAVKTRGVPEGGNGVWSRLKWEGGVHRVQRVPVTESQGRIHTSAAGVLVLPEAE